MKKVIAFLFSLAVLCSCHRKILPQITVKDSSVTHTEIKVVETVRDSVVQLPADSSWLKALLECDSSGQVLLKQIQSYQSGRQMQIPLLQLDGNSLMVKSWLDSSLFHFLWKEKFSEQKQARQQITKEVITLPPERVNYITGWQQFFIKSGQIAWGLLLLAGLGWFIQKRLKAI